MEYLKSCYSLRQPRLKNTTEGLRTRPCVCEVIWPLPLSFLQGTHQDSHVLRMPVPDVSRQQKQCSPEGSGTLNFGKSSGLSFCGMAGALSGFPGGSVVKNPPAMQETQVRSLVVEGGEIPWRTAWQPTPVFLPGESPWTEEPGGLQSVGLQRVGHE